MTTLSDALKVAVLDMIGWEQATMPISVGGLGIRDPLTVWPSLALRPRPTFTLVRVTWESRETSPAHQHQTPYIRFRPFATPWVATKNR